MVGAGTTYYFLHRCSRYLLPAIEVFVEVLLPSVDHFLLVRQEAFVNALYTYRPAVQSRYGKR